MLALHYAQDGGGNFFWLELSNKLDDVSTSGDITQATNYLTDSSTGAGGVIKKVLDNSPSSKTDIKITEGTTTTIYCYYPPSSSILYCGTTSPGYSGTVFTAKTDLTDSTGSTWEFYVELYY